MSASLIGGECVRHHEQVRQFKRPRVPAGLISLLWRVRNGGADRHHRKYFRVRTADEAIIARRRKQSWFRFIDWIAIAFTICKVQARSFTMRQSDPLVVHEAARLMPGACAPCCAGAMAESCTGGTVRPII
ncbi:hypothetical protein LRP30_06055 [Bradyrhizobium sp. C-145]|uniref:hypothetical protein n=1 Tax=Bradyrhizobium sp. C-145 TaxID=574727 RepID=UPI00201B6A9E|nr:hypothetical protein [Bradyrhizobium sp. C-145]UQR64863.1 hypothetical protein LRP30_06055 [Bradyrhizobium sp. C-145]